MGESGARERVNTTRWMCWSLVEKNNLNDND